MAYYLLEVTNAPEAWAALVDEPQNRTEAVQLAVDNWAVPSTVPG